MLCPVRVRCGSAGKWILVAIVGGSSTPGRCSRNNLPGSRDVTSKWGHESPCSFSLDDPQYSTLFRALCSRCICAVSVLRFRNDLFLLFAPSGENRS